MTFLSWRDDYAVAVPMIDTEHRYLFDLINEFHDKFVGGFAAKDVAAVLNRLVAYAEGHFQHEEALMAKNGYPRLEQHQSLHEKFFHAIFALNEKASAGAREVHPVMMRFLKEWLVDHIVRQDTQFGDFLRRKAAQAETAVVAAQAGHTAKNGQGHEPAAATAHEGQAKEEPRTSPA